MGSSRKLTIAHINTSTIAGGAATVAKQLATGQRKANHATKIFASLCNDDDISIYFAPDSPLSLREECGESGQLYYDFQGSHRLVHHPYFMNSDIVHFHNLHGDYFNPFSIPLITHQKPTVWTLHDMQALTGHCAHAMECKRYVTGCNTCPHLDYEIPIATDNAHALWKDKQAIYKHSLLTIVTPSEWLAKRVRSGILSDHPLEVIPNGVCTSTFRSYDREECRRELGLPADAIILGSTAHVGVLNNPWKGGDLMIEALEKIWQEYPNAYFLNIGGASPVDDKRILSTDHISDPAKLARTLSALDIFLYSSRADNCPLVILEAMAAGLPIVSSATGGIPELLEHNETGLVALYKNTDQLAQYTLELIKNPQLRVKLGNSARNRAVRYYDLNVVLKRYEALYEKTIGEYHSRKKTLTPYREQDVPEIIRTEAFLQAVNPDRKQEWEQRKQEALRQFEAAEYDASAEKAATLIREDPSDHELATLLGMIYAQLGQRDTALQLLQYALTLDSKNTLAQNLCDKILHGERIEPGFYTTDNGTKQPLIKISTGFQADQGKPNDQDLPLFPLRDGIDQTATKPLFLQVHTFYPAYIEALHLQDPKSFCSASEEQRYNLVADGFSAIHMIAPYMHQAGYDGHLLVANDLLSQCTWAREHGIDFVSSEDPMLDIVRAQVDFYQPEVLYLSDPIRFDAAFIKSLTHKPSLILGWRAANIPEGTDWNGFDVMLSSLSAMREQAVVLGAKAAENFWPAFPVWYYDKVKDVEPEFDVSFCGSWTEKQHPVRNRYIAAVAAEAQTAPFSFGLHLSGELDAAPQHVQQMNLGPRFGLDMFAAIRKGRISFDARGNIGMSREGMTVQDLARNETANMRLFEVTGCGRLLITEAYDNLTEIFEPGKELITYTTEEELKEAIRYYRNNPQEAARIAQAGMERCHRDHSMKRRTKELADIIAKHRLQNVERSDQKSEEVIVRYKDQAQYTFPVDNLLLEMVINAALKLHERGKNQEILEILQSFHDKIMAHPLLVILQSLALFHTGRQEEACAVLEQAHTLYPENDKITQLLQEARSVCQGSGGLESEQWQK